jgi:hypothetical protein
MGGGIAVVAWVVTDTYVCMRSALVGSWTCAMFKGIRTACIRASVVWQCSC